MYRTSSTLSVIPVKEYINDYRDADKFIAFCKECKQYCNCWACPPFDFESLSLLLQYQYAYIIGTKITPSEEARSKFDHAEKNTEWGRDIIYEVRSSLDPTLLLLEKEHPESRAFFAGTCFKCPNGVCTRTLNQPCVQPEKVRPSLESLGFDIGKTTSELLGIDLQWSTDGKLPKYFTLVSALFSKHEIKDLTL